MHNDTHLQNIKLGMQSGDSASSTFVDFILFKLCPKGHEWFEYCVVSLGDACDTFMMHSIVS